MSLGHPIFAYRSGNFLDPSSLITVSEKNNPYFDWTDVINLCAKEAKLTGSRVILPPLDMRHGGIIVFDSIKVYGVGAKLISTSTQSDPHHAIMLTGRAPGLFGTVTIASDWTGSRQYNDESAGIWVLDATNYRVDISLVKNSASAGILCRRAFDGFVRANVQTTLADGFHFTERCENADVYGRARDTGDDAFAVVSYLPDGGLCRGIVFHNPVTERSGSRGVAIVGGEHVTVVDAEIYEPARAGLYLAAETGDFETYGARDCVINGAIVRNACQLSETGYAGVQVLGQPGLANLIGDDPISRMSVNNSISNVTVIGAGPGMEDGLRIEEFTSGTTIDTVSIAQLSGPSDRGTRYAIEIAGADIAILNFNVSDIPAAGIHILPTANGKVAFQNGRMKDLNTNSLSENAIFDIPGYLKDITAIVFTDIILPTNESLSAKDALKNNVPAHADQYGFWVGVSELAPD